MRIVNGHPTTFTMAGVADLKFFIKSITPTGPQGGGPIDITSMETVKHRQLIPKHLRTYTPITMVVEYEDDIFDPAVQEDWLQVAALMTFTLPTGATVAYWGFIDSFMPGAHSEQEDAPRGTVTVFVSNTDETYSEVDPVYTPAP